MGGQSEVSLEYVQVRHGPDPGGHRARRVDQVGAEPGWQFNSKHLGLSFGLKIGLRFHFDSVTCLNYTQF